MKYLSFLLLFVSISVFTQNEENKAAYLPSVSYNLHIPAGDIADRFGVSSAVGGNLYYKFENNFLLGFDANFLFGNDIIEDSLTYNLYNSNGVITGTDGFASEAQYLQRGFHHSLKFGKLFPTNPTKSKNVGILVMGGVGFLQHKIHINDRNEATPQLTGEYAKGYDRLTNGVSITEFVGYMYLKQRVNFYIGIESTQGFTRNRRSFNFDTRNAETERRLDILWGLKAGWVVPFFTGEQESEYFYN